MAARTLRGLLRPVEVWPGKGPRFEQADLRTLGGLQDAHGPRRAAAASHSTLTCLSMGCVGSDTPWVWRRSILGRKRPGHALDRASWPLCVSRHPSADPSPTTLAPTSGPLSLATARRSFAPLARQAVSIVWSTRGCVPAAGDLSVERLGPIPASSPSAHVRALRRAPATAAALSYGRPQRDGLRSPATARGRLLRRAATNAQAEPIGGRWRLRRARAQRRETTADAVLGLVGAAADAADRIVDGSAAMGRGAPSPRCDDAHAFRPAPISTRATPREHRHRRAGRHLAPRRRVGPIAICSLRVERPSLLAHPRQPHRLSRRR